MNSTTIFQRLNHSPQPSMLILSISVKRESPPPPLPPDLLEAIRNHDGKDSLRRTNTFAGNDARSQQPDLLDAIRNHGGAKSLRRTNTFAESDARGQERGGDLMSDLKQQMETRRKALGGDEKIAELLKDSVPYDGSGSDSEWK